MTDGTHTGLARQQLYLFSRRRHRRTGGQKAGPGLHHWLPGRRHRHWPLGFEAGHQRAGHSSLCRVWRSVDAVSGRAGAGAQTPVEFAPPHFWLGQRAGDGLRCGVDRRGDGVWGRLEDSAGRRAGPGAVKHRDCAASHRGAQPDAHKQRAGRVFHSAVSGRGGHPYFGVAAAFRRRGRCRRGARPIKSGARSS